MPLIQKIRQFTQALYYPVSAVKYWIQEKNKNAVSPDYSRRQFALKLIQIFISCIAIDFLGQKLAWYDIEVYYKRLPASVIGSPIWIFYLGCQGLFLGLTVWRLFEIYWFGQKKLKEVLNY